jgi:thiamine-phosphate pyrophosphorylase
VIICLVTDRRRADPVEQARRAVDSGVDIIQVRERDLEAAALAALVTGVLRVVQSAPTRVVVNDRLDVALACGAHGVHLRSDSMPAAAARTIVPEGFLIGRSVHGIEEAVRVAPGVDYLVAGTIFATTSKPGGQPLLGIDGLRGIVRAVSVPVLAIGGVTPERVECIAQAGAGGIAGIGLFGDTGPLGPITASMRMRFDTVKPAS